MKFIITIIGSSGGFEIKVNSIKEALRVINGVCELKGGSEEEKNEILERFRMSALTRGSYFYKWIGISRI